MELNIIDNLNSKQQTANSKQREVWIDCLKGFAILCVMWCHTQSKSSFVYDWIHTFQIPLFLIATGFLFEIQNKTYSSMKKVIRKIMIPYASFSIVCIIVDLFFCMLLHQSATNVMIIDFYKFITLYGIGPLWYLPSYIISCLLVLRTTSRKNWRIEALVFAILLSISICIGLLLNSIRSIFSEDNYWWSYFPICSVFRGCSCAVFIILGKWVYRLVNKVKSFLFIISAFISIVLSLWLVQYCNETNFSTMSYGRHPFAYYACALFGGLGLTIVFYMLKDVKITYLKKIFAYYGVNSLILLGTHMSLKLPDITGKIIKISQLEKQGLSYVMIGALSFALMLIIEIPVVFIINKHPFNKMIGD